MNMRSCCKILLLGALGSSWAWADGGAVRVHNAASAAITVNSEVGYGCTADAGDTCSFVMAVGRHKLKAERHDNNRIQSYDVTVPADGFDLNLADGNP